jgi:arginase
LIVIGAPSSAGAYAPGQERAPSALRAAGLIELLAERGIAVEDWGDVPGFRWRVDNANPRAMNSSAVGSVARAVAEKVRAAIADGAAVLVLGGDCTVEIGTVAGALQENDNAGLVYIDLDTDLQTPDSTTDGALDWMVVSHLLGIEGALPELAQSLRSQQLHYFGTGNSEPIERERMHAFGIAMTPMEAVDANPTGAAQAVLDRWGHTFDLLLVHLDVDVLQFLDLPLAENVRRNVGIRFDSLTAALRVFLAAPNWSALTVCEINPDHGETDSLRRFVVALADAMDSPQRH